MSMEQSSARAPSRTVCKGDEHERVSGDARPASGMFKEMKEIRDDERSTHVPNLEALLRQMTLQEKVAITHDTMTCRNF